MPKKLIEFHCSPELAAKLGAFPATEVDIGHPFPSYEIPFNCIAIHTVFGVLAWPIIHEREQTAKAKNG
jgi:hypothetical protein